MKLRHSAKIENILESVQRWLVLPGDGISVHVTIGTKEPVQIGYSTLKEAVQDLFEKDVQGAERRKDSQGSIEFREKTEGSVTIVYAVRWDEKACEWRFVETRDSRYGSQASDFSCGTCVEGIRIDCLTPGFDDRRLVAMANLHGKDAPKTNISRDGFEITTEYEKALRLLNETYAQHVMSEFNELKKRKANSLSWSAEELNTITTLLFASGSSLPDSLKNRIFWDVFSHLPIVLIEKDGERKCRSICDLRDESAVWTIDNPFYRWAEGLLCEVPKSLSLSAVAHSLTDGAFTLHKDTILCVFQIRKQVKRRILSQRSIDLVIVESASRRIDLRWTSNKDCPIWLWWDDATSSFDLNQWPTIKVGFRNPVCMVPISGIHYSGCGSEVAVKAFGVLLLNPGSPVVSYIANLANKYRETMANDTVRDQVDRALRLFNACLRMKGNYLEKLATGKMQDWGELLSDFSEWPVEEIKAFSSVAEITNWIIFDPNESRSKGTMSFDDYDHIIRGGGHLL